MSQNHTGWRSRGYLPHLDAPVVAQHVVFRLADSLPAAIRKDIAAVRNDETVVAVDAALDRGYGSRDLALPAVAALVQAALLSFDADRYVLMAWCVMPNHVHALLVVEPGYRLDGILHSWKSYTAKEANRLRGRSGSFGRRNTLTGSCATTNISPAPRIISREIR
jgi:putative DNA methylase